MISATPCWIRSRDASFEDQYPARLTGPVSLGRLITSSAGLKLAAGAALGRLNG